MSEQSQKPRWGVLAIFAVLTVPTFGVGVWLGATMPTEAASKPPGIVSSEPATSVAASVELAACRKKLARRKKLLTPPSSASVRPDGSAGGEPPVAPVEAFRGRIRTCRRNERLHGAEICRSVRLHLDALLSLPDNDVLCIQRVRVADYIEDDFEKCVPFKNPPADWESAGYTPEERRTIVDAIEVAKSMDEEKLRRLLNGVHRRCYGAPGWEQP